MRNNYYDDKELSVLIRQLNALLGLYYEFRYTDARKQHTDELGDVIKRGDVYFKRRRGVAYDDVIKLSRASMDAVLFALFDGSEILRGLGASLLERQKKEILQQLNAGFTEEEAAEISRKFKEKLDNIKKEK